MKTDGIFTIHNFNLRFAKYGVPINLSATGDWHYGSTNHDKGDFDRALEKSHKEKAYLIGLGDYTDLMSTSERFNFSQAKLHDQTAVKIDAMVTETVTELAKKVKDAYEDRIIGLGGGNHYHVFQSGTTSDQLLCKLLECKYTGACSLTRMVFDYDSNPLSSLKYDIATHHGLGGGRKPGTSINKLVDMANFINADALFMGHDHQRIATFLNRIELSQSGEIAQRRILIGRTGSFLKVYNEGEPSYAVDALYPPSDLGMLRFKIIPTRTHKNENGVSKDRRWLHAEVSI